MKNLIKSNKKMIRDRNANIELLRIISIIMVLTLHCLQSSGVLNTEGGISGRIDY